MRTVGITHIAWGLLTVTLVTGCATERDLVAHKASQAGNTALYEEVTAQCRAMEQAMRDDDLAKVASFYADDAILVGTNGYRRGGSRAALDEYWAGFGQGVDWSLVTQHVEGREGLIVQRGRSILTYIRDGENRTSVVEFILLWQRQDDGTLKIAVDGCW